MLAEIEHRTLVDQLGLVDMIHDLVCLDEQDRLSSGPPGAPRRGARNRNSLSAREEQRLAALKQIFAEGSSWSRRSHRRVQTRLPATFKRRSRFGRGTVLDISPTGLKLATKLPVETGDYLLVRIGRWGTDQYAFPCRVQRVAIASDGYQIGLSFSGAPLRVRYAGPAARSGIADTTSHRRYRSSRWHVQLG